MFEKSKFQLQDNQNSTVLFYPKPSLFSPPPSTVKKGEREATAFPPRSAGGVAGFLALWPPLRRWLVGGGTSALVWLVDRGRFGFVVGAGVKVGSASLRIRLVAASPPSRCRLRRRRSAAASRCSQIHGSGELGFPGAGGGTVASSVRWSFVSRPLPRCRDRKSVV